MADHAVPPEIRVLALRRLAAGNRLLAIKTVIDAGLDLGDAKDYVDGLRWEVTAQLVSRAVEAEAAELAAKGDLRQAIRLVRDKSGVERQDAKIYVDALAAGHRAPTLADRVRTLIAADDRTAALATVQAETGMTQPEAEHFADALQPH